MFHIGRLARSVCLLLSLLILDGTLVFVLPQSAQQPQTPVFRTGANFVRVDVYPTADGGRPVPDLSKDDFDVLEDGKIQRIETFEHVRVRAAGPQSARVEPNTVAAADQMVEQARSRVFVLFLDTYHVGNEGSHRIRGPLVRLLDRILGQDDLLGVMTPEMSATDLTFARKTTTIEGFLSKNWDWGRRFDVARRDPEEEQYERCYPDDYQPRCGDDEGVPFKGVAREMIARRREKLSLDALQDLVRHLRTVREERKAILAISDGWTLFRPNRTLASKLRCQPVPGIPVVGVGPGGRIVSKDPRNEPLAMPYQCDTDRLHLAQLDNEQLFREVLGEANRSNATFYPIDPRGLPVFDTPIGPDSPLAPAADRSQLRGRLDSLLTLASATDGIAIAGTNNPEPGLKRIADDLSSYYLLGYSSTNTKLDGKFRTITVRVKRPGVNVRARRGYRAATEEELAASTVASVPEPVTRENAAIDAALGRLAGIRPEGRLRVRAADTPAGGIWVIGEVDRAVATAQEWRTGGTATLALKREGQTVLTADATLGTGSRSFVVSLPTEGLEAGSYLLQVRARPADSTGLPLADTARVVLSDRSAADAARAIGDPLTSRRAPWTGQRFEPTADLRFRRNEWIRVEAPVRGDAGPVTIQLLDRTGRPVAVPVKIVAPAAPPTSDKWIAGELALAALAPGEYLIEIGVDLSGRVEKVLTAFKIVP